MPSRRRWRDDVTVVSPRRHVPRTAGGPSMTYSIVARDPESGRFGVAIQTCWPFVGAGATQSFTEIAHGPNGLARLRAGEAAADALAALLAADGGEAVRQVG